MQFERAPKDESEIYNYQWIQLSNKKIHYHSLYVYIAAWVGLGRYDVLLVTRVHEE